MIVVKAFSQSSFVHYKGHYLIGTVFDGLGYCRKEECTIG